MSRTNSNEETYKQGQDVNDSIRHSRRRSNSLVTELLYVDQEGSNPDVTLSAASSMTRVQLLRMGSYGDILGDQEYCSFLLTRKLCISTTKIIKKKVWISCTIQIITNAWNKSSSFKHIPWKWTTRRKLSRYWWDRDHDRSGWCRPGWFRPRYQCWGLRKIFLMKKE